MAGRPNIRLKLLHVLSARRHRYAWLRLASQAASLGVLLAVPLLGIARVDAWGGRHALLMQPAPFKHALGGVIIGIGAMYVVTFLSNVAAGRLFCGWGCPVGQVSRFGDAVAVPGQSRRRRLRLHLLGAAHSGLFVVAVMAWWVDLRVLLAGDATAMAVAWSVLAVGVVGAYLHGRIWRWEFCKQVCPIGLYYSFVSPARYFGIHFRNHARTCIECNACDNVCPVDLTPRDLVAPTDRPGLSIAHAPGRNHCLECGDCIQACEFMVGKRGLSPVPLRMGYYRDDQRGAAEVRDADRAVEAVRSPS